MPRSEKPIGHLVTKSFLENSLPEGNKRALTQEHGKNRIKSEFGFLKEFGGDCAGAFKIGPEKISLFKGKLTRRELKLSTIYGYLKEKSRR
jgi:hypothetical protein